MLPLAALGAFAGPIKEGAQGTAQAGPGATTGTAQMGLGVYQLLRAKKIKKDNYIPPSLQQNINEAESLANKSQYVGQSYDESQIRRGSANAISRAKEGTNSAANLLNAVSSVQSKENDAMNQVAQKVQQFQMVNRQNVQGLRGQRANIEMDNMKRYWAAKSAMKGAGIQNLMGGFATINQSIGGIAGGGGGASGSGGSSMANPYQNQFEPSQMEPLNSNIYNPPPGAYANQTPGFNPNTFSGYNFNPNQFSSFNYNPNAFSAGGSFR